MSWERRPRPRRSPPTSACCDPAPGRRRRRSPRRRRGVRRRVAAASSSPGPRRRWSGANARARRLQRLWSAGATGQRPGAMRPRHGSCCWPARPESARRGLRRGSPRAASRRGRVRARRPLARGDTRSLPAVPRGAAPLRPQRAVRRAPGDSAREYGSELARLIPELRRRAPELPPPVAGRARDRPLPPVRGGGRRCSRRSPRGAGAAGARRPAVGRSADAAAAAPPGAGARTQSRLLILGAYRATEATADEFADALAELRRERLVAQVDIRGLSERETAELVRRADRRRAVARVLARAARRDRGQPVLHRGDRPPPRRGGDHDRPRRRPRAPAVGAARGRQGGDRAAVWRGSTPRRSSGCGWHR